MLGTGLEPARGYPQGILSLPYFQSLLQSTKINYLMISFLSPIQFEPRIADCSPFLPAFGAFLEHGANNPLSPYLKMSSQVMNDAESLFF